MHIYEGLVSFVYLSYFIYILFLGVLIQATKTTLNILYWAWAQRYSLFFKAILIGMCHFLKPETVLNLIWICTLWPDHNLCIKLSIVCLDNQLGHRLIKKYSSTFITVKVWLRLKCGRPCVWHTAGGEIAYTQSHTIGFGLTSTMPHVAKMHLGNCPALKGFAGRRRGMGMGDTDRLVESALDLCVCNRAISEEAVAPFLQGGVACLPQKLLCKY